MARTPVLVRFLTERLERIDAEAKRLGKPRSETIEALIDRGLGDGAKVEPPPRPQSFSHGRSKTVVASLGRRSTVSVPIIEHVLSEEPARAKPAPKTPVVSYDSRLDKSYAGKKR